MLSQADAVMCCFSWFLFSIYSNMSILFIRFPVMLVANKVPPSGCASCRKTFKNEKKKPKKKTGLIGEFADVGHNEDVAS